MMSASEASRRLVEMARTEADLRAWRRSALGVVGSVVHHDGALFHELSPRAPLERAALEGLDATWLASTLDRWDEMAVTFEALFTDGLAHGGVSLASRALGARTRERRLWNQRVARPLRAVDLAIAHLVVRERVISAVVLIRRASSGLFGASDQRALEKLTAPLAVGDALLMTSAHERTGMPTHLECVDGRLTPRQRQVVEHVALGHSNAEIGVALGVSPNTIRNLLVSVRRRLGASNRAEVVYRAVFR